MAMQAVHARNYSRCSERRGENGGDWGSYSRQVRRETGREEGRQAGRRGKGGGGKGRRVTIGANASANLASTSKAVPATPVALMYTCKEHILS